MTRRIDGHYSNAARKFIAREGTKAAQELVKRLRKTGEPADAYVADVLESEIEKEGEK